MFSGIGEHGVPAYLTAKDSDVYDSLYKVNGFNAALSDKIALDRSIPDIRHKGSVSFTKIYLSNSTQFRIFCFNSTQDLINFFVSLRKM